MEEALKLLLTNIANIFKTKTIVTLALTIFMGALLSGKWNPSQDITALFCTSYGSVMTYFFTHTNKKDGGENDSGSAE